MANFSTIFRPGLPRHDNSSDCDSVELDAASKLGLLSGSPSILSKNGRKNSSFLFLSSLILFLISGLILISSIILKENLANSCFRMVNFFTPAIGHIDTRYQLRQYNGTVGVPSPYVAPNGAGPNPKVDEAWDRFSARPMSVSEEVVIKSGEDTNAVRLPGELGGGYLAWAEVNHQLHCLNFLRKAVYWDYYVNITRDFQQERSEVNAHIDHCIEMLRQILMCHADTGVQLHHWVKNNLTPIPNANTWHQCKNFESILDWTHRMQVPELQNGHYPILPGSKIYNRQP